MRGYAREQLEAKGAGLTNYVLCANCALYWHKRVFKKHLNISPPTKITDQPPVAVIHPAWANFIDRLVKLAIDQHIKKQTERIARGDPVTSPSEPAQPSPKRNNALTVDEAAMTFGVTPEAILADFEKHAVPFSVRIPAPLSRRTRGRRGGPRRVFATRSGDTARGPCRPTSRAT
jgi:hypothetical protein